MGPPARRLHDAAEAAAHQAEAGPGDLGADRLGGRITLGVDVAIADYRHHPQHPASLLSLAT
jgi:hypothetical protein